jgi:hypothetical protein
MRPGSPPPLPQPLAPGWGEGRAPRPNAIGLSPRISGTSHTASATVLSAVTGASPVPRHAISSRQQVRPRSPALRCTGDGRADASRPPTASPPAPCPPPAERLMPLPIPAARMLPNHQVVGLPPIPSLFNGARDHGSGRRRDGTTSTSPRTRRAGPRRDGRRCSPPPDGGSTATLKLHDRVISPAVAPLSRRRESATYHVKAPLITCQRPPPPAARPGAPTRHVLGAPPQEPRCSA